MKVVVLSTSFVMWSWLLSLVMFAEGALRRTASTSTSTSASGSSSSLADTNYGYIGITVSLEHVGTPAAAAAAAGEGGSGSSADDDTVTSALISSYNDAHQESGYFLNTVFKVNEVDVPGEDGAHFRVGWYKASWGSDKGLPDDRKVLPPMMMMMFAKNKMLLVGAQATDSVNDHEKFVEQFCNQLRTSGKQEFATITSCAIDFTYSFEAASGGSTIDITTTPQNQQQQQQQEEEEDNAAFWPWNNKKPHPKPIGPPTSKTFPFRAEIDVMHVKTQDYDTNKGHVEEDVSVLEKAFLEAYNEIHAGSDWDIDNIHLERLIEYPENNDDEEEEEPDNGGGNGTDNNINGPEEGNNLDWKRFTWSTSGGWYGGGGMCRKCPDDDDSFLLSSSSSSNLVDMLTDDRHGAFESLVQHKLRTCGLDKYKNVRDVRIRFIYSDQNGPALEQ